MSKAPTAKRERDGWRVVQNTANRMELNGDGDGFTVVSHGNGRVFIYSRGTSMPPARAMQFAAKVAAIAARAAKEVR